MAKEFHDEISDLQNKWAAEKMKELHILKPGETLNARNKGAKFQELWQKVDLKDVQAFEKKIEDVYGELWVDAGATPKKVEGLSKSHCQ